MTRNLYLMIICAILNGCHNHTHEHEHDHDHGSGHSHEHEEAVIHEEDGHHHDGEIEISPERQQVLGISVDTVSLGEFNEIIHTSGQIVSATGDEVTIVAKTEGIVSLSNLSEGSSVGMGSRIATISTKSLGGGDKVAKARITFETAKKEYERDLQLREDNIVSESHLDRSRLEYEHAKAEYEALTSGGSSNGAVVITSPLSGFIKSLGVKSGDYVETGTPIATVSQNRRLRLKADVSEKYYGKIAGISDANFTTSYSDRVYNLKELGGRLVSYGRTSDGDFYIPVTFEFDNKGDLVAGSYVDVFLKTSGIREGIHVPLSAVVEDQGVNYIFVVDDEDGAFIRREVTLGQSDGQRVLVTGGLQEGESIVVTGAIHVKLAGVTSVPAGHTHNH